ncbi:MAG: hypothetical protein LBN20_03680 [Endomicrobium sp.]|nr:hypothetical protein [Endomicrobium sp.]
MTGLGNAAEDSAALSDTIWCVDCGIYKIYGNARAGFLRNYECTDCLDCFYLKSQNPINTINLSQNEILNQCFDCWTMLNELENVSMVLN